MGKYGAGSPAWNRVKEMMIIELASILPGEEYPVDMRSFSRMDLLRSNTINDLPPDWKKFAAACEEKLDEL